MSLIMFGQLLCKQGGVGEAGWGLWKIEARLQKETNVVSDDNVVKRMILSSSLDKLQGVQQLLQMVIIDG